MEEDPAFRSFQLLSFEVCSVGWSTREIELGIVDGLAILRKDVLGLIASVQEVFEKAAKLLLDARLS